MLRLLLLRHAKAEKARSGERDHERTLAERGRGDAPKLGAYIAKHGYRPDLAVVSTSARTRETWSLAAAAMKGKPKAAFEDRVYDATPRVLLDVVRETGPKVETLLMVGHNPGLHELAMHLVATGDIELRERLHEGFPTAALAVIEFAVERWDRVHPQSGRLERFVTPKSLAEPAD